MQKRKPRKPHNDKPDRQRWLMINQFLWQQTPFPGISRRVNCKVYLVLPLKLCPHLSELCVSAWRWLDVIHDVNVNVAEDNAVPVACSSWHVINYKMDICTWTLRRCSGVGVKQIWHQRHCLIKLPQTGSLTNVAKYNAILSGCHLDVGLDVSKIMRGQS